MKIPLLLSMLCCAFLSVVPAFADDDNIQTPAISFEILTGTLISGDALSLAAVDGNNLVIAYPDPPKPSSPKASDQVLVEFDSFLPQDDPMTFSFAEQARILGGFVLQSDPVAFLFNWQTGSFETVGLNDELSVDFIEPKTGKVRGRLRWVRPLGGTDPTVVIDSVFWNNSPTLEEVTYAESLFRLTSGTQTGVVEDTFESDDTYLEFRSHRGPDPRVIIVFDATELCADRPENPGYLELKIETSANTLNLEKTVSMFNWSKCEFEEVYSGPESQTIDQTTSIGLSDEIYRYAHPTNGAVRAKVEWVATGFTSKNPWTVRIDRLHWQSLESVTPLATEFFNNQDSRIDDLLDAIVNPPNANTTKQIYSNLLLYPTINPEFWGKPLDFSGTSWVQTAPTGGTFNMTVGSNIRRSSRTPTLIAPDVFVYAWHVGRESLEPGVEHVWTDSNGAVYKRSIVQVKRIGMTDIGIGKLNGPLPPSIPFYRISAAHEARFSRFNPNAKVVLANQFHRIFLSRILNYSLSSGVNHADLDPATYPVEGLISGDSSEPIFFIGPFDEMVLVSSHFGRMSGPIYGFYEDEINAVIQNDFGTKAKVGVFDLRTPSSSP